MDLFREVKKEELEQEIFKFKEKMPNFMKDKQEEFLSLWDSGHIEEALKLSSKNTISGYLYLFRELREHVTALKRMEKGEKIYTTLSFRRTD